MFGPLGFPEVVFILILALLVFGPKRLPEIGRTLGKGMAQFRRATTDLRRTIEQEIALDEAAPARAPQRPVAVPAGRAAAEKAAKGSPEAAPAAAADEAPSSSPEGAPVSTEVAAADAPKSTAGDAP